MISGNLAHIRPLNEELIHRDIGEQNADREYVAHFYYDEAITCINKSKGKLASVCTKMAVDSLP